MSMLHATAIIMAVAIFVVSITKKFGFGSVPGYILAGVIIGPWGFNLISDAESILHFAEIGVILLLFIIGLGLRPSRLWLLRKSIFGLGTFQVLLTTLIFALIARLFLESWVAAVVIGFGLSLSSTAFALQIIADKGNSQSPHGRVALHILLFQDLVAIPALAFIPLISVGDAGTNAELAIAMVKTFITLFIFWLFMRYLLRPILGFIASTRTREIFTAASLLLVLGSALVMESVGISLALGAFLAGVLVAGSEYRHQLEADIDAFKGLLLGLFFITIGISVNFSLLTEKTASITIIAIAIVLCKAAILLLVGYVAKLKRIELTKLAICLSQGGEFGFILFSLAAEYHLLASEVNELLIVAVTLSMITTPLIFIVYEKIQIRFLNKRERVVFDEIEPQESRVIIAGFSRFAQIISRILRTQGINFTAIELDPDHVDFVRRLGSRVYYGDASNKKLLEAAGIEHADIFILAVGNVAASIKIASLVKREYPNIRLFARARTRMHEMQLRALGAEVIIRDTLLSSMYLAEKVLVAFGLSTEKAEEAKNRFYVHDVQTLDKQFVYREDLKMLIQTTREASDELERLFMEDRKNI